MGLKKERVRGWFGELSGRLKKTAGAATGDRELEARGEGREAIGRTHRRTAERADRFVNRVEGSVGRAEQRIDEMKAKQREREAGRH
jgi:uncharacterized protein YjbJ (UPF0337 family)